MSNAVFELDGRALTVKPVGELDSVSSPVFEKELRQHLSGVDSVVVDFEKVNYISSAGLRVFLAVENTLDERGVKMKLIHVNEHIIEIFDLVGFMDVVEVE